MRRAPWAAALLASGLVVRRAGAEVPVRLTYQAGPGCPDQTAFVALVRARNAHIQLADERTSAPLYGVTVEDHTQGARGRLVLAGPGGGLLREVRAERCDEVADVLALVLALSLDPTAPPPPALSASAPPAPSASAPPAPVAPPTSAVPSAATPAPSAFPDETHWGVGAFGSLRTGVAPAIVGGGGLAIERRTSRTLLRGSVSLGTSRTLDVDSVEQATVQIRLAAARIEACGWPLGLGTSLALWPCAGLEGGALVARGGRIAHPGSAAGVWAAVRGLGLLRWSVSPRLALEAAGGLSLHLTRHTFVFEEPERVAARPALLGAVAAVGVVVTIP